jgi:peptidyl-prolyl cis-trans isomerase-like 2
MKDDPTYNINISGDLKQMIKELGTEKGNEAFLQGGGGLKAQKERAAALAAILARKEKDDSKARKEPKPNQSFSIVDAASASVHGRSAAAAKATSAEKTAARIAMHMAGERAPVNAKLVYSHPVFMCYAVPSLPVHRCCLMVSIQPFQVKSRYTTGAASRSFTSTSYDPVTKNEYEYVKVERNPKKKGYVQLHTTHGDLNLELHCDITPRTCENFLTHCENGYYNGLIFHRSIKYVVITLVLFFSKCSSNSYGAI